MSDIEVGAGAEVYVWAYGAWREGIVTGKGRTRITVQFTQNEQGDRAARPFAAGDVVPRGAYTIRKLRELAPGLVCHGGKVIADVRAVNRREYVVTFTDGTISTAYGQTTYLTRQP